MLDIEEWRPVPGYENTYEVSSFGQVRRIEGKSLKPCANSKGYLQVTLHCRGKGVALLVNRLVLMAFRGIPPEDFESCHGDDIKCNNRLSNLRWGTRLENAADKVARGRTTKGKIVGTNHPAAKLTDTEVLKIRHLAKACSLSSAKIAVQYGVSKYTIQDIVARRSWAHI